MAAALALYLPPGKTLELRLTNNHYSMISVRRKSDGYRLRLHRMFVGAEPRVVRALARYVVHNDRRASTLLGEYIEQNQHIIRQQARRPRHLTVRTAGRHHDLQAIFDRLNARALRRRAGGAHHLGAGRRRSGTRRRSIKMGSFAVEDRVIRIHPALDQACVPDYFVAWIVFHEMLHGKHEVKRENGRRRFHTPGVPRRGAPVPRLRARVRLGEAEPRSVAAPVARDRPFEQRRNGCHATTGPVAWRCSPRPAAGLAGLLVHLRPAALAHAPPRRPRRLHDRPDRAHRRQRSRGDQRGYVRSTWRRGTTSPTKSSPSPLGCWTPPSGSRRRSTATSRSANAGPPRRTPRRSRSGGTDRPDRARRRRRERSPVTLTRLALAQVPKIVAADADLTEADRTSGPFILIVIEWKPVTH